MDIKFTNLQPSLVAIIQGTYYALTGLWPLIHYESFEVVTGQKIDDWLVLTVGLMLLLFGLVLIIKRNELHSSSVLMATAIAAGLAIADIWFYLSGVLSIVYVGDALVQTILIFGWWVCRKRSFLQV